MTFRYTVAGLGVASDIALSGLLPSDRDDAGELTITIRRGSVPPPPVMPERPLDELLLPIADTVRLALRRGREMLYDPEPGVTDDMLGLYLAGTGFGALLHQRGQVVLHASAVRVGEAAVLFCGPSGAGKSTLAAALGNRGFAHVSDDFCAVRLVEGEAPRVMPDGRRLKLWQPSVEALALGARRGDAVHPALAKFYVEPRRVDSAGLPIAALYLLEGAAGASIERLAAAEAMRDIIANAYRPQLVALMRQERLYFDAAAAIARHCGLFRLERRLDFAELPTLLDRLEEHWCALGLGRESSPPS